MLVAILLLWCAAVAQADELAVLKARIGAFDAHARYPLPTLSDADLRRLQAGKVVKVREGSGEGPQRVTGLLVVSEPKERLFISASDPHLSAVDEVTEVQVPHGGEGYPLRWYQFLDLPRPFADRHWVIDVRDNVEMHERTGGQSWEHWWTLTPDGPTIARGLVARGAVPGVTPERVDDAIYVDVNTGAYLYIDLPGDRTLFGFHATSAVGGAMPDGVVSRWSMLTVGRLLKNVVARVAEACAHYGADHEPVLGGDGSPIPPGCKGAAAEE